VEVTAMEGDTVVDRETEGVAGEATGSLNGALPEASS
jgi:hypothetical protein